MNQNFSDLSEAHQDLTLLFFEHQKALLDKDFPKASLFFREYQKEIQNHTGLEEEWLLPIYEERIEAASGGSVDNFVGEHSKILMYLQRLQDKLVKLKGSKKMTSELISLLDDEARFKEIIRHHDEREERFLFPELDRVTNDEEKSRILIKMSICEVKKIKAAKR